MTQEFRLFFWFVVATALVISGAWAAWRLFFGKRTPGGAAASPRPITADGVELLHVERSADGRVRMRVYGQELAGAHEIGEPKMRTAVRLLLSALGGEPEPLAAESPMGQETPAGATAVQAATAQAPAADAPDDELRRPFFERVRESFAKPQVYAPMAASRTASPANAPAPAGQPWTFARINEIVERLRREVPQMPDIELSGEGAEIRIWFDGKAYRGLDDVPDERARALIREAIAQWERE